MEKWSWTFFHFTIISSISYLSKYFFPWRIMGFSVSFLGDSLPLYIHSRWSYFTYLVADYVDFSNGQNGTFFFKKPKSIFSTQRLFIATCIMNLWATGEFISTVDLNHTIKKSENRCSVSTFQSARGDTNGLYFFVFHPILMKLGKVVVPICTTTSLSFI